MTLTQRFESDPDVGELRDATKIRKTLIQMGDKYRDNDNTKRAAKTYNLAKTYLPHEAQEKLSLIPQWSLSSVSGISTYYSFGKGLGRTKMLAKVSNHSSHKPSLTEAFFPKEIHLSLPSLISQNTLIPQRNVYTFNEAQDTNSVVTIYIDADEETKLVLRNQINEITNQFDNSSIGLDAVQELVILAKIPDRAVFLHVITQMLKVLKERPLLESIVLQEMGVAINSCPEEIDMSDMQGTYLEILRSLKQHLETVRTEQNEYQLILLLHALSALLNAMVCKNVSALDRETILNPLIDLLDGLKSDDDTTVTFLAMYAKQSLAHIDNNESLSMSIFHRARLAILMAGNIADGISSTDIGKFESEYNNFTAMCNFSIQDEWYLGLAYVDCILELQNWSAFEAFVLKSKLRSDKCFLQGICLHLEQIVVTQRNGVHHGAIGFPQALAAGSIKIVQKTARAALKRLGVIDSFERDLKNSEHDMSKSHSDQPISQIYRDSLPPVWDSVRHTATRSILLRAVQQKEDARVNNDMSSQSTKIIEDMVIPSSLGDVHEALQSYYKPLLFTRRVSGETLPLESCYINLAVVEAPCQREKDRQDLKRHLATFQRMPSYERTEGTNMASSIPLEELFNQQELRNGNKDVPKTILIHGRAGIGKTTLCKKLVQLYQNGRWRDRFDAVLWLPLRELKNRRPQSVDDLLIKKYFSQYSPFESSGLARTLSTQAENGRVLFILDGLDELQIDDDPTLDDLLAQLLRQQHIVITSRPSGVDKSILPTIDLELETVGFSSQNVKDYLQKVIPEAAEEVEDFIQQTPIIQGLVNIPVQLDAICFSWGSPSTDVNDTMTGLYQAMVRKLWCKDAIRLKKTSAQKIISASEIQYLPPYKIDKLMDTEIEYLGYLAFKGLKDRQIIFDEKALSEAIQDLDKNRQKNNRENLPHLLLHDLKKASFLHSPDADLNTDVNKLQWSWNFLHLTFQEYFAATWIARHLQTKLTRGAGSPVLMMTLEEATKFVQEYKYNPHYEIVWWMVAGQLKEESLVLFFDLLQGEPVDLIGGYQQRLLAACLNESRGQLEHKIIESVETQLEQWVQLEMATTDNRKRGSILGSMSYFPEEILIRGIHQSEASRAYILRTLGERTSLSQPAITVLLEALQDKDWGLKRSAVSALRKQSILPESVILALAGALQDGNRDISSLAVEIIERQSKLPESTLPLLISMLQDDDGDVRKAAVSVLGKKELPESVHLALVRMLQDQNEFARKSAVSVLEKQFKLPESAILALVSTLYDYNKDVRKSAFFALRNKSILHASTLLVLVSALQDEYEDVRISAASIIRSQSTLPESALIALASTLQEENENAWHLAASVLGEHSTLPEPALLALIDMLQDKNEAIRKLAAVALRGQSMLPEPKLPVLVNSLRGEYEDGIKPAASVLGNHLVLPESVLPTLIGALQDKNEDVRKSAVSMLGMQSTLPESSLPALVVALQDKSEDIKYLAAIALARQTLPESAVLALIDALQAGDEDARHSAYALGKQSVLPESALLALIEALHSEDIGVRDAAAEALGEQSTSPESVLLALISALQNTNENARSSAAYALGKRSKLTEPAILALIGAISDENEDVRYSVAEALENQSTLPESAIPALVDSLHDENGYIRHLAAKILGKQPTLPESTLLTLINKLQAKDEDVRKSAVSILGKQSTLPESAHFALNGALRDKNVKLRYSVAEVLGKQSALPELELLVLIGALNDGNDYSRYLLAKVLRNQSALPEPAFLVLVGILRDESRRIRDIAAEALRKQPTLPESALLALISTLQVKDEDARKSAVSVLGSQPKLSESALLALTGALRDKKISRNATEALRNQLTLPVSIIQTITYGLQSYDKDIRQSLVKILAQHVKSVFMVIPALSPSAIETLHGGLLVRYGSQNSVSLWVHDHRICFHTAQGVEKTDELCTEDLTKVVEAFDRARKRTNLQLKNSSSVYFDTSVNLG